MRHGFFITLEGGEGVGKSTQVRRLVDRLIEAGRPAIGTREPGGSPKAEAVRSVLLSGKAAALGPAAEAALFAAARIDHLDTLIRPSLKAGTTIVSDRFIDSTRVYQGAAGQVPAWLLSALEEIAIGPTRPDLTLVLDLPSDVGLARAAARRAPGEAADRFESEALAFHEGLRQGFRSIAAAEPERCALVDASGSAEEVAEAIWAVVKVRLLKRAEAAE